MLYTSALAPELNRVSGSRTGAKWLWLRSLVWRRIQRVSHGECPSKRGTRCNHSVVVRLIDVASCEKAILGLWPHVATYIGGCLVGPSHYHYYCNCCLRWVYVKQTSKKEMSVFCGARSVGSEFLGQHICIDDQALLVILYFLRIKLVGRPRFFRRFIGCRSGCLAEGASMECPLRLLGVAEQAEEVS